jgi:Holliday junction resolvasome RuvABC DNA-binding subunit
MVKRIMVTLDDEQYEILQRLKGFGKKDAEKIRNVLIAYLSEKSYLKEGE